ncbi:MAG: hypothetical protein KDB00_23950, partial [Planctomycetales bacterium]|nr:hypothetical protein [Planctomycetales bacterium]
MHKSSFNQSPALRAATLVAILVSSNLSDQPGRAYATDPIRHAEPDSSTDQPCVLLRNGNVLFGSAVKIGDMICITRDDQSTINLPTSQVESIGKSLHELYEFRRQDRFPDDLKRVQSDI